MYQLETSSGGVGYSGGSRRGDAMLRGFYLLCAVLGAVIPWWFNYHALVELGTGYTPKAFFLIGFQGSPLLGSVAADFWVGSIATLVWMVVEARRLGMRHWWVWIPLTFGVAWACALPLFLFFREGWLAERTAKPH